MIQQTPSQKLTVVIVSDAVATAQPVCDVLAGAGYRLITTDSEQDIARLAVSEAADTIVIALPERGAAELHQFCCQLKRSLGAASVPLLLVRAAAADFAASPAHDENRDFTAQSGADDFLSALCDREEILVKVARLTERHRVEQFYRGTYNVWAASSEEAIDISGAALDQYRLLFESSPLPMWVYDLETLGFLAVNQAAVRHYGYTRDEFLRMTIKDIRPAEDVTALLSRISQLEPGLDLTGIWRHCQKQGSVIDVEITSHELMFDGRRARLVLANDVTERRRAEAALAQQAEREALVNRISSAVRRSLDPAEVFRTAVDELGVHLGVDRCLLFSLTGDTETVRCVAEYVAPGISPARREYPAAMLTELIESIRCEGVLTFDDIEHDARLRPIYENFLRHIGVRSIMYVAIRVGDDIPAALAFSTVTHARRWRDADVAVASAVAVQTGIAIRQAQLFKLIVGAKEEWETTFNAMSDAVLIFNEHGDLTRVNRAGAALERMIPENLIGRRCCQILHAEQADCIVTRALAEKRRLTDEISLPHFKRSLLFTAEPIAATDGRVIGAVCFVRDLSELRKIEAVAREQQSLLRSVLDSAREAIYALDVDARVQWCNKGVAGLGGYAPEDLIGRRFPQWARPEDHAQLEALFALTLRGEPQSFEMSYFGVDGQLRCAMVDHSPLVIDGRTTGVLGIARDITEIKMERERAAQADKLRALGQLASGVAHDFNNALAAIIGRAQLLSRLVRDATLATHLDVIQTAAADAAATVRRIQTFARQPRVQEFELLNAETLLRDAIELTRMRWEGEARARDLRYDVQLNADAEIYIEGAASELREVFVNLIVNAIDAMPDGGSLQIACRRRGDRIQLLFADTGRGISEEVRKRIFEPFFTTKGAQGTGLGLFVSYGIIERHRGLISVESDASQGGTTFAIELPAIEAAAAARAPRSQTDQTGERQLSILVVDDEPCVRETLAEFVVILAHRVVKADGGRAALAAIAAEKFDLVLLDLSMPGLNGWEVAKEIRRSQPHARIVLTTGYGPEAAPPIGGDALVDDIIGKPCTFGQIAELIAQMASDMEALRQSAEIVQKAG